MEMYHNTVQDAAGNIINGAVITVKLASDNSIATIYDKDGSALSNPFVSGYDRSKGETDFKAANELYNVEVVNGTTTTIESISLIDPNTFSTGMTAADRIKLDSIESSADVTDAANVTAAGASIANMTLVATDVVEQTNLQSWATGVGSALLRARGTGVSSTYVSSVTVNGTVFAQPSVSGEINGDQGYFTINYAGATGISVSNLTSSNTFVYINNAGNLAQQTSEPTREDWVRKIFVMRIAVDPVAQTILGFEYLNNPIGHYANSMRDLYSFMLAQGLPFKKDQIVTGRSSDLGFDVSAGSLLEFGGTGDIYNPNIKNFSAVTNATFFLSTRTAFDSGTNTNLPKLWDNNGTLTILGSTTLVAHRLYRFSNGNICLQYGQANYANMTLAKAGAPLEQYVLNPGLKNATFFGWWFIELSASNTGGTTLTDFVEYTLGIQGGSSSGLSGSALRANNLSDLTNTATAKTNIGLGTTDSPTFAGATFSGIVDILGGTVKLNNATMSGVQVVIANDAVAPLIFPNRRAGFLSLVEGSDDDNFSDGVQFQGYASFGSSKFITNILAGGQVETNASVQLTGMTGTDGKLTIGVAGVDGTLYIENRRGGSRTVNINLL
jgi:hypothetical protein